jgi:hypothetical protein
MVLDEMELGCFSRSEISSNFLLAIKSKSPETSASLCLDCARVDFQESNGQISAEILFAALPSAPFERTCWVRGSL